MAVIVCVHILVENHKNDKESNPTRERELRYTWKCLLPILHNGTLHVNSSLAVSTDIFFRI